MGEAPVSSIARLKVAEKLSTGNAGLDVAICCALPVLLKHGKCAARSVWQRVRKRRKRACLFERSIAFTTTGDGYCLHNAASHNKMLHDAVMSYLSSNTSIVAGFQVRSRTYCLVYAWPDLACCI
jgi:hypothetical protein